MTDAALIERLDRIERLSLLAAKTVLTIDDTALLTGYSIKYLRSLIADREIPYYKRGNRLYFRRDDVEGWMQEERVPTRQEVADAARHTKRAARRSDQPKLN